MSTGTLYGPLFQGRFRALKSTMLLVGELREAARKAGVTLTHEQLLETARVVRHGLDYSNDALGFRVEVDS